jgi:D-arabinose 1-dehydrogenase-like Zn-dependent alcohol dehydrogenase
VRAVVFDRPGGPLEVRELPAPAPPDDGVVLRVTATGICRSDWHAWRGHDPDITFPHVLGHELAGVITAVGPQVRRWAPGARVTVPFVCACGRCAACRIGDHQVCEAQEQPGATHHGSFAEQVALHHADVNLVAIPDEVSDLAAAALGCRFSTAFRAVVAQGRVRPGEWVAVHGVGGVGRSAVMVAVAAGARVVAVDVDAGALGLAQADGAEVTVDAAALGAGDEAVAAAVRDATDGGAHLSLDAFGDPVTCRGSIRSLRRRGRHVQVGLLPAALGHPEVPMDRVVAHELELLGSHGMAAHAFPELMATVAAGRLRPQDLVTRTVGLAEAPAELAAMDAPSVGGVTVIDLTDDVG